MADQRHFSGNATYQELLITMSYHRGVSHRDLDDFLEESRQRQRNVVFPDTVRNARSVDAFLWKGSPNPTRCSASRLVAIWAYLHWVGRFSHNLRGCSS